MLGNERYKVPEEVALQISYDHAQVSKWKNAFYAAVVVCVVLLAGTIVVMHRYYDYQMYKQSISGANDGTSRMTDFTNLLNNSGLGSIDCSQFDVQADVDACQGHNSL